MGTNLSYVVKEQRKWSFEQNLLCTLEAFKARFLSVFVQCVQNISWLKVIVKTFKHSEIFTSISVSQVLECVDVFD